MEDSSELQRMTALIVAAMHTSTDPVTAAGVSNVASLKLESVAQVMHLARCIAVFTTDDALANEMGEIVDESLKFLASKVSLANFPPEQCRGEHADLEKRIWTSLYAGRRERSRVQQTLARRSLA